MYLHKMLNISANSTSYYTVNMDKVKNKVTTDVLIPKVHTPGKKSINDWNVKYENSINEILDDLTQSLSLLTSDKYIHHINIKNIRSDFMKKMYKRSNNSNKHFI